MKRMDWKKLLHMARLPLLMLSCFVIAACESSSSSKPLGSGHDFGANDSELVLAVGDSITVGVFTTTPYPLELANMINKTVINVGVSGSFSGFGAENMQSRLSNFRPGFAVIMYGTNDASGGRAVDDVIRNLRSMIDACQRNQTIPILCTLTPQTGPRIIYQGRVDAINDEIRNLARQQNIALADVARAFQGEETTLIGEDNLHPNDLGAFVIAETVAKAFNR